MSKQIDVIERDAARVVLLDREQRVLLFRCQEPGVPGRSFWITPGGGLEQGETHEQAALRELEEETGLVGVELGTCIWIRTHTFPWLDKMYRQRERFYLVQVDAHNVDFTGQTDEERIVLAEHRWWSVSEIQEATDTYFAPRRIGELIEQLIAEKPATPIDVGA